MLRENMIPGLIVRVKEFTPPSTTDIEKFKKRPFQSGEHKINNWKPDSHQRNQITTNGGEINNFCSVGGRWARSELIEPYFLTEGWKI